MPVIDEPVLVYERERHDIHNPFAVVEGSLMASLGLANELLEK